MIFTQVRTGVVLMLSLAFPCSAAIVDMSIGGGAPFLPSFEGAIQFVTSFTADYQASVFDLDLTGPSSVLTLHYGPPPDFNNGSPPGGGFLSIGDRVILVLQNSTGVP